MSFSLPKWTDGNFSTAQPVGLPVLESTIPGDDTKYILTQKFRMFLDAYVAAGPAALNSAHYIYSTFKLVEEGPLTMLGEANGGVVEWTRKYAALPATHYDEQTVPYAFIGTVTDVGGGVLVTRPNNPFKDPPTSKVQYDYFLTGSGGSPVDPASIAIIQPMVYCYQNTVGGALYGGVTMAVDFLLPASNSTPTFPTSDSYNKDYVADALTNGWSGTVASIVLNSTNTLSGGPPPTSGHQAGTVNTGSSVKGGIIPIECRLTRWLGNYYQRATRYVLAK